MNPVPALALACTNDDPVSSRPRSKMRWVVRADTTVIYAVSEEAAKRTVTVLRESGDYSQVFAEGNLSL